MKKFLEFLVKYLEQSQGLSFFKHFYLIIKIFEYAVKSFLFNNFTMNDIWNIKHQNMRGVTGNYKIMLGVYELEEQIFFNKILKNNNARNIVDIGSAVGTFTSLFAKSSPCSKIFSFEPNPVSFGFQKNQIALNNFSDQVEMHNMGLADKQSIEKFSYENSKDGVLWGNFGIKDSTHIESSQIKIDKFDSIVPESSVDLVKIDIEGYELKALRGMQNTILKDRPIILCEVSLTFMALSDESNLFLKTLDFINKEIEYDIFLIDGGKLIPYNHFHSPNRVINLVLISKENTNKFSSRVKDNFLV